MYDYAKCPFKPVNWMSVSDSISTKSEVTLNSNVAFFLNSLKELIVRGDTSDLPILRAGITKTNQEFSISKAQVSQSFYESHLDRSMRLCEIWNYIRKNEFINNETKIKYQELLDRMILGIENETKALNSVSINQNNYGNGIQNNTNIVNPQIVLHAEDTILQATNFEIKFIDSNTIQVNPQVGEWENPFVAVKFIEKDCLLDLKSASGTTSNYLGGEVPSDKSIYLFSFVSLQKTVKKNPVFIKLKCQPSLIYFGDRADIKKQYSYNIK